MSMMFRFGDDSDDEALEQVALYLEHPKRLELLVAAIRQALDEVIATARTGRWNLDQCNDQEKAYVGVNLENIVRLKLELPPHRPRRPDFVIEGVEVDCKWSRKWGGWQIPVEAVGHICLLMYGDDLEDEVAIGLIRIQEDILVGGNRDKKRTLQRPEGLNAVRWLRPRGGGLPPNFLMNLRKADRDAILEPRGGDERAKQLFKRCDGLIIHRSMIEAIGQQVDEARRFRGETREALRVEGYEVLNGHWKQQKERAQQLGGPVPHGSDQWVSLRSDGSSYERRRREEPVRQEEARVFRRQLKAELASDRFTRKVSQVEKLLLERLEEEASERVDATREAVVHAEHVATEVAEQLSF